MPCIKIRVLRPPQSTAPNPTCFSNDIVMVCDADGEGDVDALRQNTRQNTRFRAHGLGLCTI